MAWVKMRTDLLADPRIVTLAELAKCSRVAAIGGCYVLWSTADTYTVDGKLDGYTLKFLDEMVGIPNFGRALTAIGWLEQTPLFLRVPRFDEHNGQSAKARAQGAERVKRYRNSPSVTESLPDKRKSKSKKTTTTARARKPRAAGSAAGAGGGGEASKRKDKTPELGRVELTAVTPELAGWAKAQARRPEWLPEGSGWIDAEVWLWLAQAAPAMTANEYEKIMRGAREGRASLRNPAGFVITRILELGKRAAKPGEG